MATYPTLNHLPDLSAGDKIDAIPLYFYPYMQPDKRGTDNIAGHITSEPNAILNSIFKWQGRAGATYDIFSWSSFDPSYIRVYDAQGNAIAVDIETYVADGFDSIWGFVAPYTGTYYVSAGWNQGKVYPQVELSIWENIDTILIAPEPSPPQNITQGTERNDRFAATDGEDKINGRAGFDTVTYTGNQADHVLIKNGSTLTVGVKGGGAPVDVLASIEALQFSDGLLDLEYSNAVQALYIAYFGRAADTRALDNFQAQLIALNAPKNITELSARYDTDMAVRALIDSFGNSAESQAMYGGKDTAAFINTVYQNIFERTPDADGLRFWTAALDSGALTKANASLSIMSAALTNTTQQGLLDGILVNNKINVAANFTFAVDTAGKEGNYAGATAAAMVRNMLIDVDASTDIATFQAKVVNTVNSLPPASSWAPAQDDSGDAQLIGNTASDAGAFY